MIIVGLFFAFIAGAFMVTAWNIWAVVERAAIHWRHRRRLENYAMVIFVLALALFALDGGFIIVGLGGWR